MVTTDVPQGCLVGAHLLDNIDGSDRSTLHVVPEAHLTRGCRRLEERTSEDGQAAAGAVRGVGVHVVAVATVVGVVSGGTCVGVRGGAAESCPLQGALAGVAPLARAVVEVAVVAASSLLLSVGTVRDKVTDLIARDAASVTGAGESALVGRDGGQGITATQLYGHIIDGNVAVAYSLDDALNDEAIAAGVGVGDGQPLHLPVLRPLYTCNMTLMYTHCDL